jgi:hypothetical protein
MGKRRLAARIRWSNVPGRGCECRRLWGEAEVISMERLTAEDQLMLWPDEIWPQGMSATTSRSFGFRHPATRLSSHA